MGGQSKKKDSSMLDPLSLVTNSQRAFRNAHKPYLFKEAKCYRISIGEKVNSCGISKRSIQ
jgi:hypothetical protein